MRRTGFLFVAIALFGVLVGCIHFSQPINNNIPVSPDIANNTSENIPASLTDDDFIVKNENTYINLGGKYEDFRTNEKIINSSSADENHAYDIHFYKNFSLNISPANSVIWSIILLTQEYKTFREISVGDSISDVVAVYGVASENWAMCYIYRYDNKTLAFYYDEVEVISRITFDMT